MSDTPHTTGPFRIAIVLGVVSLAFGVYTRVHWPSPVTGSNEWMALLIPVATLLGLGSFISRDRPKVQNALAISSMAASVVGVISIIVS
jgi:hypothetical protein